MLPTLHLRSLSALLGTVALAALSAACGSAASQGESVGEESSAVVCGVNTAPGTVCTSPGSGANLPYVAYLSTSTTDLTATVSFLTQRGPTATTFAITSSSPSYPLPAPVVDAAGSSHTLTLKGLVPATHYNYAISIGRTVEYSGSFVTQPGPAVVISAPPMIRAVEQITYSQLDVTLTGVDHPLTGTLHVDTSGWSTIVIPDITVSLGVGERTTVLMPITLPNPVAQGRNSAADLGQINLTTTFSYEARSASAPTLLRTYPETIMMGVAPGGDDEMTYNSASCAGIDASGFLLLTPNGEIDMEFGWDAESFSEDPSKATLFRAYWRGLILAEGVFPRTQSSLVYSKYTAHSAFFSSFTADDYTAIQDDQWASHDTIAFTCVDVPASTVVQ